jgi:hypothetical protein
MPGSARCSGDRRIEMLARSFTSEITDLNLKRKEIRCVLPVDSLKPFKADQGGGPGPVFRAQQLQSAVGDSRHPTPCLSLPAEGCANRQGQNGLQWVSWTATGTSALAVSVKIGSYSLVLDFTEQRRIRPATTTKSPAKTGEGTFAKLKTLRLDRVGAFAIFGAAAGAPCRSASSIP